ncbi:MAG: 4-hydroxybenzoate octaprenyltransferase [Gammaproteobacteria bacterium]|nr:4-hydroxybenzoate octaprenyltransferase [Pseudomonadota bacterium]TDJ37862.1 MAG: 4-hydroxybenzoate octaprenyltransferase [Gammaproteobacteria bacterium]
MKTTSSKFALYLVLMRLDRPVGSLLLLWPTLAALWIAADGIPPLTMIIVFTLGTLVMRSAGCVMNDYADREVDGHVERTRNRPLATGLISRFEALLVLAGLCTVALLLLVFLNPLTRWLAVAGLAIAMFYPFMKRWTYLPQVVLGAAFSWGMIMAFAAIQEEVPAVGWLLFVASVLWIVAYDTLYAMVDREDDIRVGIKSTAILFGNADRTMVGLLQLSALFALVMLGEQLEYWIFYQLGLIAVAGLFIYQQYLIRNRNREACFQAFANNVWVGFALFLGVVLELSLTQWLAALTT